MPSGRGRVLGSVVKITGVSLLNVVLSFKSYLVPAKEVNIRNRLGSVQVKVKSIPSLYDVLEYIHICNPTIRVP